MKTNQTRKLSLLWLGLCLLLLFFQNSMAQSQHEILDAVAYVDKKATSVGDLLEKLKDIDSLYLAYRAEQINLQKNIKLPSRNLTVKELLDIISEATNTTYQIHGKQVILKQSIVIPNQVYAISGYIRDKSSGEALIGANVFIKETLNGTSTNLYGFYSLSLPAGEYVLLYSYMGYTPVEVPIMLTQDLRMDIELQGGTQQLEEVTITSETEDQNVSMNQMGFTKIEANTIQKIPVLMGEADVLKAIKLLPGIQTTSETSSGFSVRGGSADQNLILLDEATVYNASHLLGFFSVFNNDAIKSMELYKGNMPARYGGRLSSLMDIRMREGNNKKISGSGGISLISSRLTLESPIVKDKGSVMLSGRRTYADVFTRFSPQEETRGSQLYFYDFNFKANYKLSDKDHLFASAYLGRDVFGFGGDDQLGLSFDWGNITSTLRWNHIFNEKLFSNVSVIASQYDYKFGFGSSDLAFTWKSNLHDYTAKVDMDYFLNPQNTVSFGFQSTYHQFDPGKVSLTAEDLNSNSRIQRYNALEHAVYVGNDQKIGQKLSLYYGLRFSIFQNIGEGTIYNYDENYEYQDSTTYKKGEIFNTYAGLEPRLSATYLVDDRRSVKLSYSRTNQYLHLASNSIGGTPLDVWLPSTPNIKPQLSDQIAAGYFCNLADNMFEASVEVYYKHMRNQIDFRNHAQLLLNKKLEGEMRFGTARAYGAEFLLRKQKGNFTGWASYTWSRALRTIDEVNDEKEYPSIYDRPHKVTLVGNYQINQRLSVSANWVYYTGQPFTAPTGRFYYAGEVVPVYTGRNGDRLPNYHRLDVGITLEGKKKSNKWLYSSWNLSVYNAYNRKNANMISFQKSEDNPNVTEATKYYVFPIIPTVTWNFHF